VKHNIEVMVGTIDRDYTGNVVIKNNSTQPYHIAIGDRMAQMALYHITQPPVKEYPSLPMTE
jgi:dUTPase